MKPLLFDTHCHLNFAALANQEENILEAAQRMGVGYFMVPGSNLKTSQKAVSLAKKTDNVFAAVGIHPHHAQDINDLGEIESLLATNIPLAVGEIGLDYHQYQQTKYDNYQIDEEFKNKQKDLLIAQIKLAQKYHLSIIFHNREAKDDFLTILEKNWDQSFTNKAVLHCCEADEELLDFAKGKQIFIGVDGDVTYSSKKAKFIQSVPLEKLVLETDSPYLTPQPIRSQQSFPNQPQNLSLIADYVAQLKNISQEELAKQTTANAKKLFDILG